MGIIVHCPNCHEKLEEMRQDCAHCGADLPPGIIHTLALSLGVPHAPPLSPRASSFAPIEAQPPVDNSALRPWLATVLSLVCGLGQLYNGQSVKGILLMVLGTTSVLGFQLLIGKIMTAVIWVYAMVDAYLVARRQVRRPASRAF